MNYCRPPKCGQKGGLLPVCQFVNDSWCQCALLIQMSREWFNSVTCLGHNHLLTYHFIHFQNTILKLFCNQHNEGYKKETIKKHLSGSNFFESSFLVCGTSSQRHFWPNSEAYAIQCLPVANPLHPIIHLNNVIKQYKRKVLSCTIYFCNSISKRDTCILY